MSGDGENGAGDGGRQAEENKSVDQSNGQSGTDHQRDDRQSAKQGTSTAEKAVMVISITFTVLLFAYAGWQMVSPPTAGPPEVSVVETTPLGNDSVAVTVRLRNPSDVGLITATVESNCSSPPAEVGFSYIPALSTRTGTLVCPSGTTDPSVSVANWVRR